MSEIRGEQHAPLTFFYVLLCHSTYINMNASDVINFSISALALEAAISHF